VLLLAACAVLFKGFAEGLGATLCEGQRPGVCEAQQDDADPWWTGGWVLVGASALMFVVGSVSARNESAD
jgi:hypothetical protein